MKRKITLFAAVLALAAILTPCIAFAETDSDVSSENVAANSKALNYYDVTGGRVCINEAGVVTGCDNTVTVIDLEELAEKNNIEIKAIGYKAFMYCSGLKKVVIPKGVTKINDYAFYWCSGLTEVVIPEGVTTIGDYAFWNCTGLTKAVIPEGVTTIGHYAFYKCSELTEIVIPKGVTTIGDYAFYGCDRLTKAVISEGVTTIGNYAFSECNELTEAAIPKGVKVIGDHAFYHCYELADTVIPEGVTTIGDYAFCDCDRLTKAVIPEGVTTIGGGVFRGCSELMEAVIPNSVTTIGSYAFSSCPSIKYAEIPDRFAEESTISSIGLANVETLKRIVDDGSVVITDYDEEKKTFAVVVDTDVYGGSADESKFLDSVNVLADKTSVKITDCYYTDATKKYIRFDVQYTNNSSVDYVRGEVVSKDADRNDIYYVSERQDIV